MKIKFERPDADAPGFLLRNKRALELQKAAEQDPTPESLDELVDFLAEYVVEPEDIAARKEALYMASENQFNHLLSQITGDTEDEEGEENPT